jgi:IS5 family transposase
MYRQPDVNQLAFEDFVLPFGGKLRNDNRWVLLANQIPWAVVEAAYAQQFSQEDLGSPAKSSRLALGALILKERLGVTDRELVAQIAENPYLQYFVGLTAYQHEAPFHHSLLTTFRKRFTHDSLGTINEAIAQLIADAQPTKDTPPTKDAPSTDRVNANEDDESTPPNGQLLVDATCVPADITYPTDLKLLNDAREKTEAIIDHLHVARPSPTKKPRTYRQKARQAYLRVAKARRPGRRKLRQGIGKQLRYLRRNLSSIAVMAQEGRLVALPRTRYRQLLVIQELYRQQLWMYMHRCHRIADRLVSLSQPHVRPIVRGKAGTSVEFGAKISVSVVDGVSFVDRISWDAYNESVDLVQQIDAYRRRFGHDPASVHVDQIYRTRENRRYCAGRGIRLSGPPLGRPRIVSEATAEQVKHEHQQAHDDATARMAVEGKFGQAKRRFGLGRLMAKLALTSETMIHISFLVMNLEHLLTQAVFSWLLSWWQACRSMWNGLLGPWRLQMPTTFRDERVSGVVIRGGRVPQCLVGV